MFTADQARQQSRENLAKLEESFLDFCFETIKQAIVFGWHLCRMDVPGYITNTVLYNTERQLQDLGFSTDVTHTLDGIKIIIISW